MQRWHRFWRLNGYERGVALEAACGLAGHLGRFADRGLSPLEECARWLPPSPCITRATNGPQRKESGAKDRANGSAAAARNFFVDTNCLEQSLVLWWLLRRRGIAAELRIGARKEFERFEAHAWVEVDSAVLNDATAEHQHFVPFDGPITPLEARTD